LLRLFLANFGLCLKFGLFLFFVAQPLALIINSDAASNEPRMCVVFILFLVDAESFSH